MIIDYRLTGAGWAECVFTLHDKKYTFSPGYLTDALGEILEALLNVNPVYTQECYLEDGASARWDAEPQETEWNFKYLGEDQMEIALYHYEDERWNPEIDLKFQYSYDEFLKAWVDISEQLLLEYGIVGYKEMWVQYEFPLSNFLKLKYYLEHHTEFPVDTKTIDEITMIKSKIEMETTYIRGI